MKLLSVLVSAIALSFLQASAQTTDPVAPSPAHRAPAADYGNLPLSFEPNQGQSNPQVKFIARGTGYSLYLTNNAAVLSLSQSKKRATEKTDIIRMEFSHATSNASATGTDQLPGIANYFTGNDPAKWHTNIPTYSKVAYKSVYPGIDLVYYGNQRQLEYDFVLAPNADPNSIQLHFAGAKHLQLTSTGDLKVVATDGSIVFRTPVVYQMKDNQRQPVQGKFKLLAHNKITFKLGAYDHSRQLVIDPTLAYSTFLGGNVNDAAYALSVDSSGYAYVAGQTQSTNFPVTPGAYQTKSDFSPCYPYTMCGSSFISKLNPDGSALVYSTYLANSFIYSIATSPEGNVYVTGGATTGLPVTSGAFQPVYPSSYYNAAFVTELNASGSALVYSTYLGPASSGYGIALDTSGNVYISGLVSGNGYPTTSGALQTVNPEPGDVRASAFVTKLNPAGSALVYSTFLGGSGQAYIGGEFQASIAVDSSGNAYIGGSTLSTDFPVTANAYQHSSASHSSGFIAKLNPSGSALVYSTYLGTDILSYAINFSPPQGGQIIAVDPAGNAYLTGTTSSPEFPVTPGAFQSVFPSQLPADERLSGFVSKLNPQGTDLVYSTFLGGSLQNDSWALAVDASGDAYITGTTTSADFPVTPNAYQPTNGGQNGGQNAFLAQLNPAGSALVYSTFIGGTNTEPPGDLGTAIVLDPSGNLYLTGATASVNFPTSSGAFQKTLRAGNDYTNAFVAKYSLVSNSEETFIALISSLNPAKQGRDLTFTATVTSAPGGTVPIGFVTYALDGKPLARVPLDDAGHAIFSTYHIPAGTHTLTATYAGDTSHAPSSTTLQQVIIGPPASVRTYPDGIGTTYGFQFPAPFAVVSDAYGYPVPGIAVTFTGAGIRFSKQTAYTDSNGVASVDARALIVGTYTIETAVQGLPPVTYPAVLYPGQLYASANSFSVPYGSPMPRLTYKLSGFVYNDNASIITGTPIETTAAKKESPPGTYPIILQAGTLQAPNYQIHINGGATVTITQDSAP